MSLTGGLGEHWGGFLSYGMGYIPIVVIPTPPAGKVTPQIYPRIIEIPVEIGLKLKALGLLKKYQKEFPISSLSVMKLQKIQTLISELKIQIPEHLFIFLNKLELMEEDGLEVSTEELKILASSIEVFGIEPLSLLREIGETIKLSFLNYIESKIIELKITPLDLYKMKIEELTKRMTKYLELLDLLESLSKN